MDAKEIDVQVINGALQVTGERKEEREEKGRTWHKIERRAGSFSRTVGLPCAVQDDKTKADYKDGVLTVTLPKSAEARPRKVKVGVTDK
jgi:HSP20 family protein